MIDPTVSLFILLTVTVCCAMWARFLPKTLRGHAVAAIIWTAITGCQTFMLIIYRERPNPIGHLALLVSGWVMVSAWRQLAERRRGEHDRQSRRSLAARLFVQTLWGPLALGIALWGARRGRIGYSITRWFGVRGPLFRCFARAASARIITATASTS